MGFLEFQSGGGAIVLPLSLAEPHEVLRWSDRATWSGKPPRKGDLVRVPAGRSLLIDQDIHVAGLEIAGTVLFDRRDIAVRCGGILVHGSGTWRVGTEHEPFAQRLTITLDGSIVRDMIDGLGSRFLAAVDGGAIEIYGPRRIGWGVLGATAAPGSVVIRLAEAVDWQPGERIAIASGGLDLPLIEERKIFSVSNDGLHVTLDRPLQHRHLGRHAPVFGALPGAIGKVALLSRALVVEGDDDSREFACGAHCLIAGHAPGEPLVEEPRGSLGRFFGVEFRRMGQFNRLGRYPLHWHHNGGDRDNALVDCVVHDSFQRGVVVIGTQHVKLHGNTIYKPYGHGFIVDQADDSAQILTTNLTIRPRIVRYADAAMRALAEHKPRAVWFLGSARPRLSPQRTARD
jgi:hypothetical protein